MFNSFNGGQLVMTDRTASLDYGRGYIEKVYPKNLDTEPRLMMLKSVTGARSFA